MYSTYADSIDALNLKQTTHDLKDIHSLIKQINDENGGTLTDSDKSFLAQNIGQFAHWSDAYQEYESAINLSAKISKFDVNSDLSKEQITDAIIGAVGKKIGANGEELTIDTLLRVRPSAIHIDPTTSEVTIDEDALAIATANADVEKAA